MAGDERGGKKCAGPVPRPPPRQRSRKSRPEDAEAGGADAWLRVFGARVAADCLEKVLRWTHLGAAKARMAREVKLVRRWKRTEAN